MKIAILLLCHKQPKQINYLLDSLDCDSFDFFIHMDRKSYDLSSEIIKKNNVHVIDKSDCADVQWGTYGQVEAILTLIKTANSFGHYDYFWLCSGQDFPLKKACDIEKFFNQYENSDVNFVHLFGNNENKWQGRNYIKRNEIIFPGCMIGHSLGRRVLKRVYVELTGGYRHTAGLFKRKDYIDLDWYFGATWWCLSYNTIQWIISYVATHLQYVQFFKKSLCPDECFFHTLVMMSPYKDRVKDYLHYVDWSNGGASPKTLGIDDYEKAINSNFLMARKIDMDADPKLFEQLRENIKQ